MPSALTANARTTAALSTGLSGGVTGGLNMPVGAMPVSALIVFGSAERSAISIGAV